MLCLPGGLATAPFYDDVLAEPALAASGVRAIAMTLPGFGRVPFPPGFDASVEAYAAFAGNQRLGIRTPSGRYAPFRGSGIPCARRQIRWFCIRERGQVTGCGSLEYEFGSMALPFRG